MDQAFTKSGGTGGGSSPQVAEFIATYLDVEGDPPDRSLRLPVGTWQLFVEAHYSTKGCGDDQRLESSVTVVVDPAAPAATGMPTSRPASDTPATTVPGPPSSVTLPPPSVALPYPEGCAAYGLSPRRCTYIVEGVAKQAGAEVDTSRIELLGDPDCRSNDPYACGVLRSTAFVVRVRITPTSGTSTERSVFCGVFGEYSLTCSDDPRIMTGSPTMSGYHDVPCTEEGPIGCATALPTISSAAASDAEALEVMSLDIPVDHVGTYSIPVGRAVLPNGILSDASFRLADDSPADLVISPDGGVFLHVSDAQNGEELFNYYDHGWRSGVEEVEARLTFTVESFDPGAVLTVRDLVVR